MPDLNHSHKIHRKNLASIWKSGVWHEAKIKFLEAHQDMKCERCGMVGSIVPGHQSSDYLDMPSYVLKVKENRCEALCPTCNWRESKGMKPCPQCVQQKKEKIRYIPDGKEYCWDHRPEEEKVQAENRKLVQKQFIKTMRKITNAKKRAFYQDVVRKNGKRTG